MKKIKELNLKTITIIQTIIATTISLIYQFIIPMNWNPLDVRMFGPDIKHGDPDRNICIATLTQWYFSFSIAWLIYRDNPYLNSFLVYMSFISAGTIIFLSVVLYQLFWDYVHITPFVIDIYILKKKRETLYQKWIPQFFFIGTIWFYGAYFLHLAYFGAPLWIIIIDWAGATILNIALSYTFYDSLGGKKLLIELLFED
ncbi:MAG: hypothetical protein ACFFAO_14815 [Candidatus Hermodarchaeota archaeon]